jgi:hypothetical protein
VHWSFILILIFSVSMWTSGCSRVTPQTKSVPAEPKIHEEDIREQGPAAPRIEESQPQYSPAPFPGSNPGTLDQPPVGGEAGPKQPRRFIWRDKKGSKSWESPLNESSE